MGGIGTVIQPLPDVTPEVACAKVRAQLDLVEPADRRDVGYVMI